MTTETTTVNIGSLENAWKLIGRVSAVNAINLSPFKESDVIDATAGSLLQYELQKGALPLMLRARLDATEKSVTLQIRVAKNENHEPKVGDVAITPFEKFYDEAVTVIFSTSSAAIAAERGGFYADTFAIDGTDETFKGIEAFGKWAKTTFVDIMGFQNHALVCTVLTGAWAEVDITNS